MLSKSAIKNVNALKKKKFRQKYHKFMVEGDKIAQEIINQPHIKIHSIYAIESWAQDHAAKLAEINCNKIIISEKELKSISNLMTPNKVLMILEQPSINVSKNQVNEELSLVLDGIQDPGNLGTIWRIADWFGINHLFCSENCVDIYNPKVIQASMGAFLRVKAVELNIKGLFSDFPEVPVYGAVLDGENIYQTKRQKSGFILIGNESRGIGDAIKPFIQHKISIPAQGGAESLNAAVATGIICSVFVNQILS